MVEFASLQPAGPRKRVAAIAAIAVVAATVGGYAIHEHNTAQALAAENAQTTATLNATRQALSTLTAKVNMLASRGETPPAPTAAPTAQTEQTAARPTAGKPSPIGARPRAGKPLRREDSRYRKLQAQVDAQGKAIEQNRSDLASTRTELTGSIAHTHDELVLLEKKGERNYAEFDLSKSKQFRREGPFEVRLKKANSKHQYADLELIVDDRTVTQKHVNLDQPVMFYAPDNPQPAEVVINNISKDHIHGYVSSSKYRQSELASMANAGTNASPGQDQGNSSEPPTTRQKLPVPQPQP